MGPLQSFVTQSFLFVPRQFVELAFCLPMGIILFNNPIVIIGSFRLIPFTLLSLTSGSLVGVLLALFEQCGVIIQRFCMIFDNFIKNGITHQFLGQTMSNQGHLYHRRVGCDGMEGGVWQNSFF